MVKAEEIRPLLRPPPMHDAGLGLFRLQAKVGQQRPQPRQGGLGLLPGLAHHQQIVGEANEHSVLADVPCPVEPMQVDVAKQRD